MGLDMYLKAEKYVGGWEHGKHPAYDQLVQTVGVTPTPDSPAFAVTATVGYWRKANHIHKWFVDNVQGGVDECQTAYVSREQLAELRDLCKRVVGTVEMVEGNISEGATHHPDGKIEHHTRKGPVVAQKQIAHELLPTSSGFFFGSTEYDEYYVCQCEDTAQMLAEILDDPALADCDFYYRASW